MKKLVAKIKAKVLPNPKPIIGVSTAPGAFVEQFTTFKEFYDEVRDQFGPLREIQVAGFDIICRSFLTAKITDSRHLDYMLATTWHETAQTMHPIVEYGSAAYLRRKAYYPYIGRGFVQLTWKANYEKYGIARTPEKALELDMAAHILIDGMSKGVFTGRRLDQYFNATTEDPVGARRIINGTDRSQMVAGYYHKFKRAVDKCPAFDLTPQLKPLS